MPTILLNKISPKGTTVKDLTVGSKPVKFARIGSNKLVYDTLSSYTYGTPTITISYSTLSRNGGSVTPTVTYSQTRTKVGYSGTAYGSDTITGTITSFSSVTGSVLNSSGATIDTTNGKVTRSSLGTTYKSAEWVIMKVTITATVNGKSGSATVDVKMLSNTYTDSGGTTTYGNVTAGTITNATVPASGGTKTATAGNGSQTWSKTAVIRTYQTGSTETVTAASSGTNSVSPSVASISATGSSLGTTILKQTTLKTLAVTWSANGKSASGTMYVYQAANLVTAVTANSNTFSYANIGAGATSATPSSSHAPKYTFTSGSTSTTTPSLTYGSLSTSVSYSIANTTTNGFTACNSSTGVLTATARGTTIGTARASATVTKTLKYTWTPTSGYGSAVNSGNLTKTATCTQNANLVTAVTANSNSFSYSNIGAGATSATPSTSHAPKYTFSSGSTSTTTPGSTYGSLSTSCTYSIANTTTNGFTACNSSTGVLTATARGTTIGTARASATVTKTLKYTWTHTSTYGSSSVNSGNLTKTATCTLNANLVTAVTANSNNFSYAAIGAGATSATPTTNHAPKYTFSSGSTSTTTPSSTYGSLTTSVSYSIANTTTNGFTACNSSTGVLTATSRGATYGASTRTSATVTKTLKYTWTHTSTYGSSSVNSGNLTKTATCTQGTNKITEVKSVTVSAGAITYNGGSTVSAAGLTLTSTNTTSATASAVLTLQSGSTMAASTSYGSWSGPTYSWSETDSTSMMSFTSSNAATISVTIAGRAKVVGDARSAVLKRTASFTFTVGATYSSTGAALTKTNTGTALVTINQQANSKSTVCTNLVISDFHYITLPYTSVTASPLNLTFRATTVVNYTSGQSDAAVTNDVTNNSNLTKQFSSAKGVWSINSTTGAITSSYNSSNYVKDDTILCTATYLGKLAQKQVLVRQLFDSSARVDISFVPDLSTEHSIIIAFSTSSYIGGGSLNYNYTYCIPANGLLGIPVNDGTLGGYWTILDSSGNPTTIDTSMLTYVYIHLWNFNNPGWSQIGGFGVQSTPTVSSLTIYGWGGLT